MRISDWSSDVCSSDLVTIGASRKMTLFDAEGMMVSCRNTLRPSAKLCSRPQGPTTLGPRRSAIAAHTLRSTDRKSGVAGKSVSVRVALGGCRSHKKQQVQNDTEHINHNIYVTQ